MTHLLDLWNDHDAGPESDAVGRLRYRSNLLGADRYRQEYAAYYQSFAAPDVWCCRRAHWPASSGARCQSR